MTDHPHHDTTVSGPVIADLQRAAATVSEWVESADRILIGAGAGLSVAAGFDCTDTARFAELFPALYRLGLRARYQLIGLPLPPELLWGYWATHVDDIRFSPGPFPVYERLHELVADREHFVITSNVDALFPRNGFSPERVFAPQGDYGRAQCEQPCTRETWSSEPIVRKALAAYDFSTGAVTDPGSIPACPQCGGAVFLNVHKGSEYVRDPALPPGRRLIGWLGDMPQRERLLVLDIGSGYSTPSVIRWNMERVTRARPNARLLRVNSQHPDVPDDLKDRATGLAVDVGELLATVAGQA